MITLGIQLNSEHHILKIMNILCNSEQNPTFARFRLLYQTERPTRKIRPPKIGIAATSITHVSVTWLLASGEDSFLVVVSIDKFCVDFSVNSFVDFLVGLVFGVDVSLDECVVDGGDVLVIGWVDWVDGSKHNLEI